jgi:FKBP-type peptidyl-prolyl cis-trans isomerase FkpA
MIFLRMPHRLRTAAVLAIAGVLALGACAREPALPPAAVGVEQLQVIDLVPGAGTEAVAGAKVTVHYSGWLYEPSQPDSKGKPFDSSRESGRPFTFTLGAGQVIAGWDQGVLGMKVGGQRRLVIPHELAYGERGAGGVIPPRATLVFDVELLEVR